MICNTCKLDSAVWIFLPDGYTSCSECTRSLVTALEQQVEKLRNELTDGIAFAFNMMEPRVEADLKDTLDEQLQVLEASYVARRQALIQAESTAKLAQAQIKHDLLVKAQAECERLRESYESECAHVVRLVSALNRDPLTAWHWLGDGSDDLASMGEDMAVLIRAGDLRTLVAEQKQYVELQVSNHALRKEREDAERLLRRCEEVLSKLVTDDGKVLSKKFGDTVLGVLTGSNVPHLLEDIRSFGEEQS